MNKKIKLTYFLHSPLGEEDSNIYIKDLLNNYFYGMSNHAYVCLFGSVVKKQFFHNMILEDVIETKLLDLKSSKKIIKKSILTWRAIRNSDICFLFMPCMSSVLAGLMCVLQRRKFVVYFGADWYDLVFSGNPNHKFEARIKKLLSNILSLNCLFSLHTGKGILNKNPGTNKYLTSPILNFSSELFYKRESYSDFSNSIKFLFVGSLTQNKGITYLLEAIKIINDKRISLHIIGDGVERSALEVLAEKLDIKSHVIFHGYIENGSNLFEYYRNCDVFILPSFSEGLPRVLYEAAGSGCTIITTPVNSIPYLFQDNYDCLFIKPGDVDNISKVIKRFIYEPGLNKRLAENAYNTVEPILKEKAYEQHFRLINEFVK